MQTTDQLVYNSECASRRGPFRIEQHHVHVCASGERFPTYIGKDYVFDPGLCTYVSVIRRGTASINTRLQLLRGATALIGYASHIGVSLADRIAFGAFLSPGEQIGFDGYLETETGANPGTRARRHGDGLRYLRFRWRRQAASLVDHPGARTSYLGLAHEFAAEFSEIFPSGRGARTTKQGLAPAAIAALATFLVDPVAAQERWPDRFVRARNVLLLLCFVLLGHRVGEFLCLCVADVDLEARLYRIRRLHNSPLDPRKLQPLTKGFERELRWPPELLDATETYLEQRAALPKSASHDFLFVGSNGSPMTRSLLGKVFRELHERLPNLGDRFSPHTLRHTWNDLFSEAASRASISPEQEIRARMLAMGWVSRATATTYTRRSDAQAVDEVSMLIQNMLFQGGGRW